MTAKQCELTTLQVNRLEAITRHDWRRVREIDEQIALVELEIQRGEAQSLALARQLWPGARVTE
jgi:predicted nucleic acid-binding protein